MYQKSVLYPKKETPDFPYFLAKKLRGFSPNASNSLEISIKGIPVFAKNPKNIFHKQDYLLKL